MILFQSGAVINKTTINKLTGPEGMEKGSCFDVYSSKEYPMQNWNTLLNSVFNGKLAHTSHKKSICFLSGLDLIWHCLPLSWCPFCGHPARHVAHVPSFWSADIYMSTLSVMSGGFWAQSTPLNTNLLHRSLVCLFVAKFRRVTLQQTVCWTA